MFGLYSDLQHDKWYESKESPPPDKKTMVGYEPYGIINHTVKKEHMHFYVTSGAGQCRECLLYGADRNPLKDVGHCWMTFQQKAPGLIITGIAIEDDWVKMKPEYLETFKEMSAEDIAKEKKEKEKLERSLSLEMGLIGDLSCEKWTKKGDPPRQKTKLGYHFYDIIRVEEVPCETGPHQYKLFLQTETGHQETALLTHALRNAFHSIMKGYLKTENVDGVNIIKGCMVEHEWVEMA